MSQQVNHPEWKQENSLTSPADRDLENKWRPNQGAPSLTEDQVTEAMTELNNTDYIDKFPRVDRTFADPPPPMQIIGLVSFTPAKGAIPNKNGVFGFAKIRGNYASNIEANQRAEYLIRNVDSYHQIYHTYVGRPFPITASSKYSAETEEIDIRRETTQAVSTSIKDKKADEQKIVTEIKEREENLLTESRTDNVDPYDEYITLRVKKAQLSWTYLEHQKKILEIKDIIIKTRQEIADLDASNTEFKDKYYEKYMKARNDAGIKESSDDSMGNFIKFMVDDAVFDFDDVKEDVEDVEHDVKEDV
jgi:hypothetical protein